MTTRVFEVAHLAPHAGDQVGAYTITRCYVSEPKPDHYLVEVWATDEDGFTHHTEVVALAALMGTEDASRTLHASIEYGLASP